MSQGESTLLLVPSALIMSRHGIRAFSGKIGSMRTRIAIVGGGIAGLATAYHLARGGATAVTLFEREALVATHSSARNAAIYVGLSGGTWGDLSQRSRELLDDMLGRARWLRADGFMYVAPDEAMLREEAARARAAGAPHVVLGRRELEARVPVLAGGFAEAGLLLPEAGVLDIHLITSHLAERAQAAGARIVLGQEVARVRVDAGRLQGLELRGGGIIGADAVVLAPGAWAQALGTSCGAGLPLQPLRRHLAQLDPPDPVDEQGPTVWALGVEVYFRPESGGVLASPCDEVRWPPSLPPTDADALETLADRLAKLAPSLGLAALRRAWACLRTFAPDRLPVIGADSRVEGLYWLAALGGSGMSMGVGAGELLAALVQGHDHPLAAAVEPHRLLAHSDAPA
jgi:D-arginine dehydrogenase